MGQPVSHQGHTGRIPREAAKYARLARGHWFSASFWLGNQPGSFPLGVNTPHSGPGRCNSLAWLEVTVSSTMGLLQDRTAVSQERVTCRSGLRSSQGRMQARRLLSCRSGLRSSQGRIVSRLWPFSGGRWSVRMKGEKRSQVELPRVAPYSFLVWVDPLILGPPVH
ncbi:hypothetical protein BKA67DRAFT_537439 [Truncatella angustata]|uniref:Uncharacterized protein n=1 Tax=Truncatella angustata TaxID=152316 RepID=A0A9P8ZW38_9PEZI|nr:uncharacterized protein BKA67DRAFT_537439 [Truncatella angustata]KAH6651573.1 hypothetical protein BKA67DRAFT_537439 [Truncatella angustata]